MACPPGVAPGGTTSMDLVPLGKNLPPADLRSAIYCQRRFPDEGDFAIRLEGVVPYILALDEGTTSARAIVFDHDGGIRAVAQKEFRQIYPKPGWVEHDPLEIWSAQVGVAAEALTRAGITSKDVAAVGITNQRETA